MEYGTTATVHVRRCSQMDVTQMSGHESLILKGEKGNTCIGLINYMGSLWQL
jgi:hypothetical protein